MEAHTGNQRVILYYPRVLITPGPWLKQALLYWDTVGSIVPENLDRRIQNSRWMQELQDAGVLVPFRPETTFSRHPYLGDELLSEFREIVNRPHFQRLINPVTHFRIRKPTDQLENSPYYFDIYSEKIPEQFLDWLQHERFAMRMQNGQWRFDSRMGLLYMALLAKYMAEISDYSTIPGSDFGLYKNLIFKAERPEDASLGLSIRLRDLLPVPGPRVTIPQILQFRQTRRNELLQFRQEIDQFQAELKGAGDYTEVRNLTTRFSERMARHVNELERVLDDARLPFVLGTLENLVKMDTIPLIGIIANPFQVPVEFQLAGAAVVGGITIGKYLIDHRNEQRRIMRENSFSYLYQAKRQGLIR